MSIVSGRDRANTMWTDDEFGFLADHPDWPARDVAERLGRSRDAIYVARKALRDGRRARGKPMVAWSEAEDLFIIESPHARAKDIAEQLGRSTDSVASRRKYLSGVLGKSIGGGINKAPSRVGKRRLVARTCARCGLLLDAQFFLPDRWGFWRQECRNCTERKREYDAEKELPQRKAHQSRMQQRSVMTAKNSGQPYTEADLAILSDADLTPLQKALRTHRTYAAVCNAIQRYRLSSRPDLDRESGQWIIDNPRAEKLAS